MKTKNYIILFVISILTILFTFYFCKIYSNSLDNLDDSSIGELLTDVTGSSYEELYNNISNFSNENHDYVIYVASYKKSDVSNLENNLRNVVIDGNFKNVIYINVDELEKSSYIDRFVSEFSDNNITRISDMPVFICFKNQKIEKVISIGNLDENSLESILVEYND